MTKIELNSMTRVKGYFQKLSTLLFVRIQETRGFVGLSSQSDVSFCV